MGEKYIPAIDGLSIEEQAGMEASQRKLSERKFDRFKAGMEEVKERGYYDEADIQVVKNLRRDTEETTDRLEEIIRYLEGVYIGREKTNKELKDIEDYFNVNKERRANLIKLSKEATDIVEVNRNKDKEDREK